MRTRASILLLSLLAVGCAHPGDARPQSTSAILTGFDGAKEPAVTADTRYAAGQLAEPQSPQAAIHQYKEALKLDPDHLPSLYRLGVLQAQLHQFEPALDTWAKYLKATHDSADAYANLGFCQELAGRPHDAESSYRKGLDADPKNQPCTINLGLLLARMGRDGESLATLQRILTPAEARYNLASVYEAKGMKAQAQLEYRKALDLDPKFADAKQRLASLPVEP